MSLHLLALAACLAPALASPILLGAANAAPAAERRDGPPGPPGLTRPPGLPPRPTSSSLQLTESMNMLSLPTQSSGFTTLVNSLAPSSSCVASSSIDVGDLVVSVASSSAAPSSSPPSPPPLPHGPPPLPPKQHPSSIQLSWSTTVDYAVTSAPAQERRSASSDSESPVVTSPPRLGPPKPAGSSKGLTTTINLSDPPPPADNPSGLETTLYNAPPPSASSSLPSSSTGASASENLITTLINGRSPSTASTINLITTLFNGRVPSSTATPATVNLITTLVNRRADASDLPPRPPPIPINSHRPSQISVNPSSPEAPKGLETTLINGRLRARATCTTTLFVNPPQSAGATSTVYLTTSTVTTAVDCGGCALKTKTALVGPGPAIKVTKTVTSSLTYATDWACSSS